MTFRSPKLLKSAEGQPCMICGSVGTTIAAHANSVALGKGTGIKAPDFYTAWMCQVCHDLYDGRIGKLTKAEKEEMWMTAYLRTVRWWFQQQIVIVK
jgi:Protein of unknown function (DUF1364)